MLALSDEPLATIEPYVDQQDLPFLVAAGSTANGKYGVQGIPHSFLIDTQGKVVWDGHPGELSKGLVRKALKGAKRPKVDYLSVRIDGDVDKRVQKARDLALDGDLSAANAELAAILADPKSDERQKKDAGDLQTAIAGHADRLAVQAEKLLQAKDVVRAQTVLEALAKEFGTAEVGTKAKKRLEEVAADKGLQKERDAAKALERLKDSIAPLKKDKAKPKIEEFVAKYAGTRAASRAENLLKPASTKE